MPSKSKGQLEEAYTKIHIQISSFIIRDQPQEAKTTLSKLISIKPKHEETANPLERFVQKKKRDQKTPNKNNTAHFNLIYYKTTRNRGRL